MTDSTLIADVTQRIFRELGDPRTMGSSEQRQRLWCALEDSGLTRAWVDESLNGSGASMADGFEALRIAGAHAVCVPFAETLLGNWLLAQAKLPAPEGIVSVAPTDSRGRIEMNAHGRLSGRAQNIPFARDAAWLAVLVDHDSQPVVALLDRGDCVVEESSNVAGDARDTVTVSEVTPVAIETTSVMCDDLLFMGAAIRAIQMAGALGAVLDLSADYANERIAFEKPIGKFQAIQHSLAKLAGETAAAIAAAGSAADAISTAFQFDDAVFLEIASAKIRVGEAATAGAAIAHQVHGAIGFSREHVLHRYTQRLWAWRDDFGSESDWAVKLGSLIARSGADKLWPMLAAR